MANEQDNLKVKITLDFLPIFLGCLLLIYTFSYLTNSSLPVSNSQVDGWWTWWDQGKYLQAVRAFSQGNLNPNEHWYPPGYALLVALVQKFSTSYSFFLVDAFCLLAVGYCFIRICGFFEVGRLSAATIILFSTILNKDIFEQFVIPWTTTPTTALFYVIFLLFFAGKPNLGTWSLISFLSGLVVLFRPTDVITTIPILIYIFVHIVNIRIPDKNFFGTVVQNLALVFLAGLIGPLIYLAVYLTIYGLFLSDYMKLSQNIGFLFSSIPFKLYVLFVDPRSTYDLGQGILNKYPWIFLSLIGMAVSAHKNTKFFILVLCIILHTCFYASYLDLLPTGLWRYLNIHYFKWIFPFFGLFAWISLKDIINFRNLRAYGILTLGFLAALSIKIVPTTVTAESIIVKQGNQFDISFENPEMIQALDFPLAKGSFEDLMFQPHEIYTDQKELKNISEFRALLMPFGIRMLFHRPITVKHITGIFKGQVALSADKPLPIARKFTIGWGLPCWIGIGSCPASSMPMDFPYEYGSEVEFNTSGNSSMYIGNGWGSPEVWGRWTEAREAKLAIPLDATTLESDSKLTITAEIQAFVSAKHLNQSFILKANGTQIGSGVFRLGEEPHEISAVIPSNLARIKSPLEITFLLENPISPAKLGMSEDRRMLGIGLRRLRISAPHS
jgi:hypothetical protein